MDSMKRRKDRTVEPVVVQGYATPYSRVMTAAEMDTKSRTLPTPPDSKVPEAGMSSMRRRRRSARDRM